MQTATDPEACAAIQDISSGVARLCQLNASLSCSENQTIAFRHCIPALIVISVVGGVLLLALLICVLVLLIRRWKRKGSKASEDMVEMSRSLLNDQVQDHVPKSSPIPINVFNEQSKTSYEPPQAAMITPSNQSSAYRLNSNTHRRLSTSQYSKKIASDIRSDLMEMSDMSEIGTSSEETIQEKDKEAAVSLSKRIFYYRSFKTLPGIGSRVLKHWYLVQNKPEKEQLQVTVKLPKKCLLRMEDAATVDLLKSFFKGIKHPFLLEINDFAYESRYISTIQTYIPQGSVRDVIHNVSPIEDWDKKYVVAGECKPFKKSEIATCCQQVLEAAHVLFSVGFTFIGQIHCGNVFVLNKHRYVLGGYENTLLGYRSSCFLTIKEAGLMDKVDVIMLGHLIYEMCTKSSLIEQRALLTDFDYENIEDSELLDVVQHVFNSTKKKMTNRKLMNELSNYSFFKTKHSYQWSESQMPVELPSGVRNLIDQVFSTSGDISDTSFSELKLEDVILKLNGKYEQLTSFPKIGWRSGKMWARGRSTVLSMDGLITVMIVPDSCPIYVEANLNTIRELLLLEHDHLHSIQDVDHVVVDGQHVVVTFQEFVQEGALKDFIHKHMPTAPWEHKYMGKGQVLKRELIATYGGQILNAMSYLSHLDGKLNPLILGFVHTGNIFVENNVCRLGGFENVLLGYQARQHDLLEDHRSQIDVILFGHVIFEMSTGKELKTAVPTERDYEDVPKDTQQILKYIFEDDSAEIDKIMEHPYFAPACIFNLQGVKKVMETDAIFLLEKVRKGKPRNQDDKKGQMKYAVQANISKATSKFKY